MSITIILRLRNQRVFYSLLRKKYSAWTPNGVVKSCCKDVEIPQLDYMSYFASKIQKWPAKTALVCGLTNRSYTYEELLKKSKTFGAHLRKTFSIRNGDVVSMLMFNSIEYPIALLGILAAGGIPSTLNPLSTEHELERLLTSAGTKLAIVSSMLAPVMHRSLKAAKIDAKVIALAIKDDLPDNSVSFMELINDSSIDTSLLSKVVVEHEDVCILPFSSGTTGLPKGVKLTHRNIIANCLQQSTELRQYEYTTESHQDTALAVLPMFHSYGLSMIIMHKLSEGLKLAVLPAFKPDDFLRCLTEQKISLLLAAPPMMLFMANQPEVTRKHFEYINCIICGAAPLPLGDIEKLLSKAGNHRQLEFVQGYGLTESGPLSTVSPRGSKNYNSVGVPIPNVQLRVVDDNLKNLGPNKNGELLIKGPNIMKGYLNNPEANKEVFLEGGWLRSGDMAQINSDGYVYITDRIKELIKVKGYQVAPAELEAMLKLHPAVLDAAVIGAPDPKTGERPKAFVVLQPEKKTDQENILKFVNDKVAPYKYIRDIMFVEAIPKNPSGKILRKMLREKYL